MMIKLASAGASLAAFVAWAQSSDFFHSCDFAAKHTFVQRVSLGDHNGELFTCEVNDDCKNNSHPYISANGMRIVWDTDCYNPITGIVNGDNTPQILLRDVGDGETQIISGFGVNGPEDQQIGNGGSHFPRLSANGRFVVFASSATNLDPDDQDETSDIYIREVGKPFLERITELPGGGSPDGPSSSAFANFNGRFIAFRSDATDLAPLTIPGCLPGPVPTPESDIFVYDRNKKVFEWISIGKECTVPDGESSQPSITYSGNLVAFSSTSTNIVPDDRNQEIADVFVFDRNTQETIPVSVARNGAMHANGQSGKPMVAGLGRFVVFESLADNLVEGDTNNFRDIFVRDLLFGTTVRVNVSANGEQANAHSTYPAISADGRIVAFSSSADNLDPNDPSKGFLEMFLHNRDVNGDGVFDQPGDTCTILISKGYDGSPANGISGGNTSLSTWGTHVPFMAHASNLVAGDTNGIHANPGDACNPSCRSGRDVFLHVLH